MSIDWQARQGSRRRRFLNVLERVSLAVERPIARLVRDPRFNPFYHTGTITVFLLLIILVTGVYLTMFYQFGFAGSYRAVATIEASFVGRIIRGLHRYASDLAVIFAVLHAWRTFFMDRFRGPRWLAWVSGIALAALTWGIGITGYWLISDERSQLLNDILVKMIGGGRAGATFLNSFLATDARGAGWGLTFLMLGLHLGLSAVVGLAFWLHIKRLSRAKWLPPRFWMALVGAPLLLAATLIRLGMLPPLTSLRLPGPLDVDGFYLFYLPAAVRWPSLWAGVIAVLVLLALLPWALGRRPTPPIVVSAERCTGCTLCAADCPYRAIKMVERGEGAQHKYLAVVDRKLCVGCGVCIGACEPLALTLGRAPAEPLWAEVVERARANGRPVKVVFTCERHLAQGVRRPIADATAGEPAAVTIIPLTCVGMAHPDLATRALAAGAAEVQFIGCPPEDCANREGNLWLQRRLDRERLPKLDRHSVGAPITTDWLPPNDFSRGLQAETHQTAATAYQSRIGQGAGRGIAAAAALAVVIMTGVIFLGRVPFRPYTSGKGVVEIALTHESGRPIKRVSEEAILAPPSQTGQPAATRLVLQVDDQVLLDQRYGAAGQSAQVLERVQLPSGEHRIRLLMFDRLDQTEPAVLYDQTTPLAGAQILPLHYGDARTGGDPAAGRKLFTENRRGGAAGCRTCHSLAPGVTLVGPSLAGVGTRAETRVAGLSAEQYLLQSILDPDAYVVAGFPKGQMLRDTAKRLTEEQIQDLVAFLLTLK